MGLFKQSFIYIDRNKKNSYILFFLFFIIIHLILGSVLILRTTHLTMENLFTQMPNQIAFQPAPGIEDDSQSATLEMMNELRELPYVRNIRYSLQTNLQNSTGLVPYVFPTSFVAERCTARNECMFRLQGVSDPIFLEIEDGIITIVDGRTFTDDELSKGSNYVLVAQDFAHLNDLRVGDLLPMEMNILHPAAWHSSSMNFDDYLVHVESIDLEIIGFFEVNQEVPVGFESLVQSEKNMTFYTPNFFIASVLEIYSGLSNSLFTSEELDLMLPHHRFLMEQNIVTGTMSLYDFRDAEAFYDEARAILPESYTLVSPEMMGILSAQTSLEGIQDMVSLFLIGALISCLVLIGLLEMVFCMQRRQEIGIYLSLGRQRSRIFLQLFLENLWLIMPVILLSFFTGTWLAGQLNNWLLQNHLEIISTVPMNSTLVIFNTVTEDMILNLQQIKLDIPTFFIIWGTAVAAVLIGIIIPSCYLIRLSPKKIMAAGKLG